VFEYVKTAGLRLAFKLTAPLLPRALPLLLTRAAHNLEHGRWFTKPETEMP
jgi:hypothetical protein